MKIQLCIRDDEGEIISQHDDLSPTEAAMMMLAETPTGQQPLNRWGRAARDLAAEKGFDSADTISMASVRIALMHQELSEMLEEIRGKQRPSSKCPEITGEAEEAADVFLRLAQYAAIRGIDLDRAVFLKHRYNMGRPHKHGKNF